MSVLSVVRLKLGQAIETARNFFWDASAADGTLKLVRENGTEIQRVTAGGVVLTPKHQVAARIRLGAAYAIPVGEVKVGVTNSIVEYTYGEAWNQAQGFFRPTVAGLYNFSLMCSLTGGGQVTFLLATIKKNNTEIGTGAVPPYSSIYGIPTASTTVYMNGTTDTVEFYCNQGGTDNGQLNSFVATATLIQPI